MQAIPRRLAGLTLVAALLGCATANATQPYRYCQRDLAAGTAKPVTVAALASQGGLIPILDPRSRIAEPYRCARFYLRSGIDVDAVDPRPDHEGLTPLLFAIKQNRERMVRFVINHGADLKKPAGRRDLKPMAYAYQLSFANTTIDRNQVIAILNQAIKERAQANAR